MYFEFEFWIFFELTILWDFKMLTSSLDEDLAVYDNLLK